MQASPVDSKQDSVTRQLQPAKQGMESEDAKV
jgi:hypothetical protein